MRSSILYCSMFTLLSIFLSFSLYSQENIEAYYQNINKAELTICKAQYDKAGQFYEQAFENKKPFWRDLYNAAILNYRYLNNIPNVIEYYHLMVKMDNFSYIWFFDDTLENSQLYHIFKTIEDTTSRSWNENLRNGIEEIRKDDQESRSKCVSFNDKACWQEVRQVDSLNWEKLQRLYKEHGAINEYNVGYLTMSGLWVLFLHYYKGLGVNPESFLLDEVRSGNYDVREYANLVDICRDSPVSHNITGDYLPKKEYATGLENYYLLNNTFFILDPSDIELINKNRKEIGWDETWEDFKIKAHHSFTQKSSGIRVYSIQTISWGEEEDVKEEQNLIRKIDNKEIKGSYYRRN